MVWVWCGVAVGCGVWSVGCRVRGVGCGVWVWVRVWTGLLPVRCPISARCGAAPPRPHPISPFHRLPVLWGRCGRRKRVGIRVCHACCPPLFACLAASAPFSLPTRQRGRLVCPPPWRVAVPVRLWHGVLDNRGQRRQCGTRCGAWSKAGCVLDVRNASAPFHPPHPPSPPRHGCSTSWALFIPSAGDSIYYFSANSNPQRPRFPTSRSLVHCAWGVNAGSTPHTPTPPFTSPQVVGHLHCKPLRGSLSPVVLCPLPVGESVLDIGCGVGGPALQIAQACAGVQEVAALACGLGRPQSLPCCPV